MRDLHPWVWALWGVAGVVSIQIAPNPVYVAAIVVACGAVVAVRGRAGPLTRAFPTLLAIGVVFAGIRVALLVLTTRGAGPVLLTVPSVELPTLLGGFTVGGPLDGAVLARAAAEGFVILGIMAVCGAFNAVVDHHQLLRLVPRAYAEMGVAVAVAVAFVPTFLTAAGQAREADRARTGGVSVRRGRLRRLGGPVIERALEQAVSLAESMDSRGFGGTAATRADRKAVGLGMVGMAAMAGGLAVLATGQRSAALLIVLTGGLLIVSGVAVASHASIRTRHRVVRPHRSDFVIGSLVLAAPVLLAVLASRDSSLRWLAADFGWPPSTPAPLAAVALLAAPAFGAQR